jgi:UDP-GlcNAc:undecaprenyl-phosphate GlcNAc-1-phosphate transferase
MAVLTIPIFDTIAAIIRRKLTGRSLYTTDRGHLHHCLLRRGFSSRRVLLWVSLFCLLTVIGALASLALKNELFAILTALAVIVILIVTQLFGYAEFLLIRKRLTAGFLSFFPGRSNGRAQQLEVRLQGSADWRELWNSLVLCGDQLNLRTIRLDVNAPAIHEGYHARWDCPDHELPSEADPVWRAEIPLAVGGQMLGRLEVTGRRDQESVWMKIATVAKLAESFESAAFTIAFAPERTAQRETVTENGIKPPLPNGLKREQVRTE